MLNDDGDERRGKKVGLYRNNSLPIIPQCHRFSILKAFHGGPISHEKRSSFRI